MSYFGIGIANGKTSENVGTLWRSASQLGASFLFTVGRRYPKQASDTLKTWRDVPLYEYEDGEQFRVPHDCPLVVIEMGGTPLSEFRHPARACYLLGAEDHGVPGWAMKRAVHVISLASVRSASFNVAVAGSIVMYDRMQKAAP